MSNKRDFLLLERLGAADLNGASLAEGMVTRALEPGEEYPEAAEAHFDYCVNSDGALAPGLLLKGENGELLAGVVFDHITGLDIGHRMFLAATWGLDRLIENGHLTDAAAVKAFAGDMLEDILNNSGIEVRKALLAKHREEAREELEATRAAVLMAAREEGKREAQAEQRQKVLELAKAAAAIDRDTRSALLRDLKPWLKEVAGAATS